MGKLCRTAFAALCLLGGFNCGGEDNPTSEFYTLSCFGVTCHNATEYLQDDTGTVWIQCTWLCNNGQDKMVVRFEKPADTGCFEPTSQKDVTSLFAECS